LKNISKLILILLFCSVSLFAITKRVVLSPEEAFNVTASHVGDAISIDVKLGDNIYLYDDKLKAEIIEPVKADITASMKKPKPIKYEEFIIHDNSINILIPISSIKKYVSSGKFTINFHYQGCAHTGICYQPLNKKFSFDLGATSISSPTNNTVAQNSTANLSEEDQIASSLANNSTWLVLATFFGFGLLLSFTPCVFPMIPILSSIIISQSNKMTTKRAFILSVVYVLSMSLAYTMAGILAGLFGANIQAALQDPWIIGTFSAIFVILAFSMFGFFEIQMPSFIQSKLTKKSDEMQGNGILGVAIMGFLSALIVGPCIAAPLAGALVYIGQSGDAVLGGSALFIMSLGMGLPLILIGVGAGKFMPKPGGWMDSVKAVFGVIMLALAIWMLSRVVPSEIIIYLWMILTVSSSIYLGALEPLKENAIGWNKLIKSFAVLLLIYGIMLFIAAITTATNPLNPFEKILATNSVNIAQTTQKKKLFTRIPTLKELQNIIKKSSKPVMVDFYADWCISCKELEATTFSDARVISKLQNFTVLQIDVTKNDAEDKKFLKYFGVFGPPAIMFFRGGKELKSKRLIGFKDANEFLNHLRKI